MSEEVRKVVVDPNFARSISRGDDEFARCLGLASWSSGNFSSDSSGRLAAQPSAPAVKNTSEYSTRAVRYQGDVSEHQPRFAAGRSLWYCRSAQLQQARIF